jgi:hypothetical protein
MKNARAASELQRLNAAMKHAIASTVQLELQAHWARYFCVLAAGFLENAVKAIIGDFIGRTATTPVGNFARAELLRLQNPNPERLLQLVRNFDHAWATDLEAFMGINGGKEAIEALMNNRHQIAHGRQSQIGMVALQGYIAKTVDVLERLESYVDP